MVLRARKKRTTQEKQKLAKQPCEPEWLTRLMARRDVLVQLLGELANLRDKLRAELSTIQDIVDDVETAHDDLDNGREHIEQAIDSLSHKL